MIQNPLTLSLKIADKIFFQGDAHALRRYNGLSTRLLIFIVLNLS